MHLANADEGADDREKDTIRRLFAAFMSAQESDHIEEAGKNIKEWDRKAPTAVDRDRRGAYMIEKRGFVDHPYRIRDKESGRATYVSEPYEISEEGLRELVNLIDDGWSAYIRADGLHFPGLTVKVVLERKEN